MTLEITLLTIPCVSNIEKETDLRFCDVDDTKRYFSRLEVRVVNLHQGFEVKNSSELSKNRFCVGNPY